MSSAQLTSRKILQNIKRKSLSRAMAKSRNGVRQLKQNGTLTVDCDTGQEEPSTSHASTSLSTALEDGECWKTRFFIPRASRVYSEDTFTEPDAFKRLVQNIPHKNARGDTADAKVNANEKVNSVKNAYESSDDCILIETIPQPIIIDDVEDSEPSSMQSLNAQTSWTPYKTDEVYSLLTSTPELRSNNNVEHSKNPQTASVSSALFYEDKSRLSWFESINSVDSFANYTPVKASKSCCDSNEVIVLDETICDDDETLTAAGDSRSSKNRKRKAGDASDDSVIFISESKVAHKANGTVSKPRSGFIPLVPLENTQGKNRFRKFRDTKINPSRSCPGNRTRTPAHLLKVSTATASTETVQGDGAAKKRKIIIDGSNVAYSHGKNEFFSVKGIRLAIDHLEKLGHEVKVVVPLFRTHPKQSSDPELLKVLYRSGKVLYAPCKNLPNCKGFSYDDRFILEIACELDAAIVSNDNFRDLLHESTAFRTTIEKRVLTFMWCDDLFILAKDPYGRNGPRLDEILKH